MTETQNSVRLGEIIKEFHLELLHEGEDYQNIPLRTLAVNRQAPAGDGTDRDYLCQRHE